MSEAKETKATVIRLQRVAYVLQQLSSRALTISESVAYGKREEMQAACLIAGEVMDLHQACELQRLLIDAARSKENEDEEARLDAEVS
ncbi:MAG: hypothetical protein ACREKR_12080 [Candidatus Methylomirabilales bacterium]